MVSPWMQYGTIMQHLSVKTDLNVKKLVRTLDVTIGYSIITDHNNN